MKRVKLCGGLFLVLAFLGASDARAFNVLNFDGEVGAVASAGSYHAQRGDGHYVNANLIFMEWNGGIEVGEVGGRYSENVYVGLGVLGTVQGQIGIGTQGLVLKLRSDILLSQILQSTLRLPSPRDPWWKRAGVSFAYVYYPASAGRSGIQMGLGYQFSD